jgi:glycosyltransferase involved in cell wall biosynthesis
MKRRPVILIFIKFYLPGFRSGGPIRTISNFVDHLVDDFDILVVTRDRDALDAESYRDVLVDEWNSVGRIRVFYASRSTVTLFGVSRLLCQTPHDVLYLNSFFGFGFTGLPLIARRFGFAPRTPCVIAPRGEFSAGALAIKAWKKRPYMAIANLLNLYGDLQWQASSHLESIDIGRESPGGADKVAVAADLPPVFHSYSSRSDLGAPPRMGRLRIIFLSRISPMKNLDFLLERLASLQSRVDFFIYGPVSDPEYWRRCRLLIDRLPSNINARYLGEVRPEQVLNTFASYDLFVFPTRGENYGHVVLEALVSGCSVLISDRTPWVVSDELCLQVLRLEEPDPWVDAIELWATFNDVQLEHRRVAARAYADRYLKSNVALQQNRQLFFSMIETDRL